MAAMILGMSLARFTQVHVAISLIGIAAGFIIIFGMMARKRLPLMTALFLLTTILTSVTGFLFPYHGRTPGIVIGCVSLVVLLLAMIALYGGHLRGGWRGTWVVTAVVAQFFNFLVLVVQSFEKVPALHALAPTGKEMPFKVAQILTLLVFVVLGVLAFRKFRVEEE
ncbi:MAG TPA: hypothetical protein VHZ25_17265 [Acidobacteriaceae bacterium]|jgi:hypothetical protein|nr:hypothetical protein [Acidobacteriaceae bacterium]